MLSGGLGSSAYVQTEIMNQYRAQGITTLYAKEPTELYVLKFFSQCSEWMDQISPDYLVGCGTIWTLPTGLEHFVTGQPPASLG